MRQYREINPEPTDIQRATWRRHNTAGTSPGNPKWYTRDRSIIKPFVFVPNRPPIFPRLGTGADWCRKNNPNSAQRALETRYKDGTTLTRIL